jgi:2'-5' RNA ligase
MDDPREFWSRMDERFAALDRVRPELPGWRSAWGSDRRGLVLLVELGDDAIAEVAGRLGDALRGIGVRSVQREGLHLTICEFGFVDELESDVGVVARECSAALRGANRFSIRIAGAASFPTAAILRVEPWGELSTIHRRVIDGVDELRPLRRLADRPAIDGGYAPHVTIAYYEDEVATADVRRVLAPFASIEGPTIDIVAVSLVSVRPPDEAWFTWDVIERFHLS